METKNLIKIIYFVRTLTKDKKFNLSMLLKKINLHESLYFGEDRKRNKQEENFT